MIAYVSAVHKQGACSSQNLERKKHDQSFTEITQHSIFLLVIVKRTYKNNRIWIKQPIVPLWGLSKEHFPIIAEIINAHVRGQDRVKQFLTQVLYIHQHTMRCCFHTNVQRHIILSVAAKLTLTQWLCSLIKPWINFGYNTALKILISQQVIWDDAYAVLHIIYDLVPVQWIKPCYAQNILGICFPSLIKTQTELFGEKFPVFPWVLLSNCTLLLLFCFQPHFLSLLFPFFVCFLCLFCFAFNLFLSLPFPSVLSQCLRPLIFC